MSVAAHPNSKMFAEPGMAENNSFVDAFRESLKEIPLNHGMVERELLSFGGEKGSAKHKKKNVEGDKSLADGKKRLTQVRKDSKGNKILAMGDFMTVKVSRVEPSQKTRFEIMYPYSPLPTGYMAYRGYPIDGAAAIKQTQQWRLQLAPPALGQPPETLPSFPESAILRTRQDGSYSVRKQLELTPEQRKYNSGRAWRQKSKQPKGKYFFAAAAPVGEPKRVVTREADAGAYEDLLSGDIEIFYNRINSRDVYTSGSGSSTSSNT